MKNLSIYSQAFRKILALFIYYFISTNCTAQIQVLSPTSHIVFQRNNADSAKIQISGKYFEPIDLIEAMFSPISPGTGQATNWLPIQINPQGGEFASAVTLRSGWYRMEIRGKLNNTPVGNSTIVEPVGIGEVFLIVGHSNAEGGATDSKGATENRVSTINFNRLHPNYPEYDTTGNKELLPIQFEPLCQSCGISPFGEYPWYWSQLGDSLVRKLNVPVLFYSAAFGGSNMAMTYMSAYDIPFTHGFIRYSARFPFVNIRNVLEKYVPLTGLRGILSSHGINDAGYTTDSIRFFHEKVIAKSREVANRADLAWVVAISAYGNGIKQHVVDAQNQVIANTPFVFAGPDLNQIDDYGRTDGLHFNEIGQQEAARLWSASLSDNSLHQMLPIPPLVTVSEIHCQKPEAGPDLTFCKAPPVIQLSGQPTGGTWQALSLGSISRLGQVTGLDNAGIYKFVYAVGNCQDTVSVQILPKTNAGPDLTFCNLVPAIQLSGQPAGGTWLALSSGSVSMSGLVTGLDSTGVYEFVYILGDCQDTVTVQILPKIIAGSNLNFCNPPTIVQLSGQPAGGTWQALSLGSISRSGEVTGLDSPGIYEFVYAVGSCQDTVSVQILPKIDAGPDRIWYDSTKSIQLQGVPIGGTWRGLSGGIISIMGEVTALDSVGIYKFVYTLEECSDTTSVQVKSSPITVPDVAFIQVQVYLQGALFGVTYLDPLAKTSIDSLMRDDLHLKNLIPLSSPYTNWVSVSTADTIAKGVLNITGPNAIVDWVLVELRDAYDSARVLIRRSALLQRDGDVVDLSGESPIRLIFPDTSGYYIAVRHRNHLAVMTARPIRLTSDTTWVDFRNPATSVFTFGPQAIHKPQVNVLQGMAMWAGNAMQNEHIIYQGTSNDVNAMSQQVLGAPGNTFLSPTYTLKGYYEGDINMDGEVIVQGTNNDVEYIYQNIINNHPGNTFKDGFFFIREQLPNQILISTFFEEPRRDTLPSGVFPNGRVNR